MDQPPRTWLLRCKPPPAAGRGRSKSDLLGTWRYWLPGVAQALIWLRQHGCARGDRIGLIPGNVPACAALLQAVPMAGMTTVLFNHRLSQEELRDQISRACVRALVVCMDPDLPGLDLPIHILPDIFADDLNPGAPASDSGDVDTAGEPPALVLHTSGTSGQAKAARLSLSALRNAAGAAQRRLQLGRPDTWLCCLPLDHIGGASIIYRAGVCGYRVLLMERFETKAVNRALDDQATIVTGASLVPTMLHRLVEERADQPFAAHMRVFLIGGASLTTPLFEQCRRLGATVCASYGLTETASQVCTPSPGQARRSRTSCGPALRGNHVRIRRSGRTCAPGRVGIIEVRGSTLFSGYEQHGRLTRPHRAGAWFATGDLGSLDAAGNLTVHARRTDLILSGGENIYPAQLEEQLECHPSVAQAGVYGIADAHWGQTVAAVLVAHGAVPPAREFEDWLVNRLGFKRPRRWAWASSLPRTATGKLQRQRLADWPASGSDP